MRKTFKEFKDKIDKLEKVLEICPDLYTNDNGQTWESKYINKIADNYNDTNSPYGYDPNALKIQPYTVINGIHIFSPDEIWVGDYNKPNPDWKATLKVYEVSKDVVSKLEGHFKRYEKV